MRNGAMKVPGLLAVAGGLVGGFWGGFMRRSQGSVAFGVALGALSGAAGELMYDLLINNRLGEDAARLTVPEMAEYLCEHLSPEVTAYLSGLNETATIQNWAHGGVRPGQEEKARLEVAYRAAQCLIKVCGDEMTRTWFFGKNRSLRNTAPAYVLRYWTREEREAVLPAALQFAEI